MHTLWVNKCLCNNLLPTELMDLLKVARSKLKAAEKFRSENWFPTELKPPPQSLANQFNLN